MVNYIGGVLNYKPIPGYEGLYEVSACGKVRSLNFKRTGKIRIMKPQIHTNGYLCLTLYKNEQQEKCFVHRLVAFAFIRNTKNELEVNHKDWDKKNNNVSNLEWCSRRYNGNHRANKHASSSKYPGVYFHKATQKWKVHITINGHQEHLGYFDSEKHAGLAYKHMAKEVER